VASCRVLGEQHSFEKPPFLKETINADFNYITF